MTLNDRIRFLCKENNISVRRLELTLGLSTSSVSKWKNSSPSLNALQKIADYFEVSLDYLAGNSEYQTCAEQPDTLRNNDICHKDIGMIEATAQKQPDMQQRLEHLLTYLDQNHGAILFDGEIMDERTEELFTISLENLIENTQRNFTARKSLHTLNQIPDEQH